MAKTQYYDLVKASLGHSVRDVDIGLNLDLIDAAINARAVSITALEALADGKIIVGDGDGAAVDVAMSGDITIDNLGETTIGADKVTKTELAADVAGDGLVQAAGGEMDVNVDDVSLEVDTDVVKIKDLGVTIAKLEATLLKGLITAELSFEDARQTATEIYFPFKVTINKIRTIVMKQLADTNAGTITGANSVGNSAGGEVSISASALLNAKNEASPTTNNVVAADSYYKLTSAKAAVGGIVLVTLEYTRTA